MHYGDANSDIRATLEEQKSAMIAVNDQLYGDALSRKSSLRPQIDAWHDRALYWMALIPKVVADPTNLGLFQDVGNRLIADAIQLSQDAGTNDLTQGLYAFMRTFPDAIAKVARSVEAAAEATAEGAGRVITKTAVSAATPFFLIVGAVALGALMLKKAGVGIKLPFFSLGK